MGAMRATRSPSLLLARAVGLLRRAHALDAGATHTAVEGPLAEIELDAHNICAWLGAATTRAVSSSAALMEIERRLEGEAERLDEIEELLRLLRLRGVDTEA